MYVRVEVSPKAKREIVVDEGENRLKISVREPAERNMANRRVCELVATHFNSDRAKIISGHRSRQKLISVEN